MHTNECIHLLLRQDQPIHTPGMGGPVSLTKETCMNIIHEGNLTTTKDTINQSFSFSFLCATGANIVLSTKTPYRRVWYY